MFEYTVKEVNKIVDGDTVDLSIDLGFSIVHKHRFRLANIDTPESNSKDTLERTLAEDAKIFVDTWIRQNQPLKVKTTKDDKYGRMLCEIFGQGNPESLNKTMIRLGYAWEYNGTTKNKDLVALKTTRGL
jgi:micrococcal nuclease